MTPARSDHGVKRYLSSHAGLLLAVVLALALKLALELSGAITFNSDEGVMTVMSRHILRGEFPIFHYGQSYMGTVENLLMAASFLILGQTVFTARIGVILLYSLGVVGTTYWLSYRISQNRFAATAAALLVAIPPVMITLYTSVSLGAWIAILVIDNLVYYLGWDILTGGKTGLGWWVLVGLLAGVGWWELPITAASFGPLTLQGLWRYRKNLPWLKVAALSVAFLVGAAPWLYALATRARYMFGDLIGVRLTAATAGDPVTSGLPARLMSALLLNIPALFGLRSSWSMEWNLLPAGVLVIAFYIGVLVYGIRVVFNQGAAGYRKVAFISLLGGWLLIMVIFTPSPFAIDPSGRYIMLLYPPAVMIAGDLLGRIRSGETSLPEKRGKWLGPVILGCLVTYNLYGTVRAALNNPPGLTTQFTEIAHIPHNHDEELIEFLDSLGNDRGYSNFWVTFRFAFLTGERVILAPALPYKQDLSYTYRDNKYPPYMEMVEEAEQVVYVTSNHPALDAAIRARLDELGLFHREERIGPYTVFYDFPYPVSPEELGPFGIVTGNEIYE
nr:hypothetical protein [Anaerolineae bacterium]